MSERWKPEESEKYWCCVLDKFRIARDYLWDGDLIDRANYQNGNCFRTREEAEAAAEKVKALLLSLHDEQPVTDCNQLPKLTAEVFDRPTKAAFDKLLKNYAEQQADKIWQKARERRLSEQYHNGPEETKLPDWVKIGGYVYDARNGYGKIVRGSVKSCYIEFDGGAGDFAPEAFSELKPARLRPYNAEEMRGLLGKFIENKDEIMFVTGYDKNDNLIIVWDEYFSSDRLLKECTIDNKPAGVLEHLKNGEWVE